MAILQGIETSAQAKINKFYDDNDDKFEEEPEIRKRHQDSLNYLITWDQLHKGNLMKPFQIYSLILAITHCIKPAAALMPCFEVSSQKKFKEDVVLANLGKLSQALDNETPPKSLIAFVKASTAATNTKMNRETRFQFFCKALQPSILA
jgi:hypothetical protein